MTETLDPQFVHRIVATLFPAEEGADPIPAPESGPEWEDELGVTQGELKDAVRRIKSRKAPGPDGVHGKGWALDSKEIAEYMRHLLSRCLKDGRFPPDWKRAKLVLIPKEGKPGDSPSSYRHLLAGQGGQDPRKDHCQSPRPATVPGWSRS